jgi:hypothetical protein
MKERADDDMVSESNKAELSQSSHIQYYDARQEVSDSESVKKQPARSCIDWVVGLDFGTTYSGFAYAHMVTDNPSILVYYDWPRKGNEPPYCKTLTGLYYKREGDSGPWECASWGYPARKDYAADDTQGRDPRGHYLTKFKLLLKKGPGDPALMASIPPPLTLNKVITDYLKLLGENALSVIRNHEGEANFRRDAVQWCVTVPSIWDESAKQQMKACMVNAGLVSAEAGGMDAVKVVLEPEAASFHCHQKLRQDVSLNAEDKILVADIGGGTVDIVVQELVLSGDEYKVKELTESSGALCGGTFVDEAFMRFMAKKIGCLDEFLRTDPSYKPRLLKDWEEIKKAFGHEMMCNTDPMSLQLHPKLAVKWEEFEKERGNAALDDSYVVELTEQDLKAIFDPVVNEILELIDAQLTQVPHIKVMFVVGGFAGSPYLMRRIRARFKGKVTHIVSPPNPGSAIAEGAVALALHPEAIVSRVSKN